MVKNGKKSLVELIKNLSMSEKRYFKIITQNVRNKDSKHHINLFNLIDKQKIYDDDDIAKSLQLSSPSLFRKSKSYLYNSILKALRSYKEASPRVEIYNLLTNAEIIYLKGLPLQALVEVEKAEKIADEYEFTEELINILEWKNKILFNQEKLKETKETLQKLEKITSQYSELQQLKSINLEVTELISKIGFPRSKEEIELYLAIQTKSILQNKVKSIRANSIQLNILATLSIQLNNITDSIIVLKKAILSINLNDNIRLSTPNIVIPVYLRLLHLYILENDEKAFQELLQQFKHLVFLSPSNNIKVNELSKLLEIKYLTENSRYSKAIEIIEKEEIDLINLARYSPHYHVEFIFTISYTHLLNNNPVKALEILQHIIHKENNNHILKNYINILELLIHFEMNNFELINHKIRNTKYKLKKSNSLLVIERSILKALNNMIPRKDTRKSKPYIE